MREVAKREEYLGKEELGTEEPEENLGEGAVSLAEEDGTLEEELVLGQGGGVFGGCEENLAARVFFSIEDRHQN